MLKIHSSSAHHSITCNSAKHLHSRDQTNKRRVMHSGLGEYVANLFPLWRSRSTPTESEIGKTTARIPDDPTAGTGTPFNLQRTGDELALNAIGLPLDTKISSLSREQATKFLQAKTDNGTS